MYQQVTLVGNLGNDPEMRYTPSGLPVASFNLAVSKTWTNQEGQRQDKTLWIRVTAWRKLAELVSQYLSKGRQVLVIGEVEDVRGYIDRDGHPRASLEVTAQTVRFLGQRGDGVSGGDMGGGFHQAAPPAEPRSGPPAAGPTDEEIPF